MRSLLMEMLDQERLTRLPTPYYRCLQVSSTDPLAVSPDSANWFANSDRNNFSGIDTINGRKEYILMDHKGPGAVVRFWATVARYSQKGILRVYIDNKLVPVIEGELLNILSGDGLMNSGPLNQSLSPQTEYLKRGHNLYLPIPYSEACKITYESDSLKGIGDNSGEILYYNINYRSYEDKVNIESFSNKSIARNRKMIEEVQLFLSMNDRRFNNISTPIIFNEKNLPCQDSLVCNIEGEKAIRMLKIKLQAANMAYALDSTMIKFTYDGKTTVYVPIGAFFCTGSRISPYRSWYSEVTKGGELSCFWVMPFKKNCKVSIENQGCQNILLEKMVVWVSPYSWDNRSFYFAANWFSIKEMSTRRYNIPDQKQMPFDINLLKANGTGLFIGDCIILYNTSSKWWGEGDENIYVDSDNFPSHFGTGTEDYYGYAWCKGNEFSHPFLAQPDGEGASKPGYVVNLRHRSLDAIPFKESFCFDMELWHWANTKIDFSSITYWYFSPDDSSSVHKNSQNINYANK